MLQSLNKENASTKIIHGCTNPGRKVVADIKFCTVTTNVFGTSAWKYLRVTFLTPAIWRLLLRFRKICAPLT
jgi:hypothetical protein